MPNKWDKRFMELARLVSSWSKDPSTACGAVIVRPDRTIASLGFNGFPMGIEDHPHLLGDRDKKYPRVIHAEMNAILFLRERPSDCTMYVWPMCPCDRCMAHIIQTGVRRIVCPDGQPERWSEATHLAREMMTEVGGTILFLHCC